ncbi:ATP-dependent DNA helicase RecQ [Grifola frondosa]|uniref:DNA 3'-5' helicase n=1 Tax=Grifola frondosa TaxID=5627 RepID=A0A1C7ML91_GRIFR|nr:ATP-dependent DNA helicase RecQ [Grifola frondosa]
MSALKYTIPSLEEMSDLQKRNVFTIAPTGSGKTLTFWIPLLFNDNGILILVTPLNILGDKNVAEVMRQFGINAVNITAETATDAVFKKIKALHYRVIVVNPEMLMTDKRFRTLYCDTKFTSRLFQVTFDEGHCISQWGGDDFRPEYKQTKLLHWLLPPHVNIHVASATQPPLIRKDVHETLNLRHDTVSYIWLSNDRPNIHLVVKEMQYSVKSMQDLDRVLKMEPESPPPKFMVFTNRRKEAERLTTYLRHQLPAALRHKIVWFHSGMSEEFRQSKLEDLKKGDIWGIVCTDAAGMGLDIPDIVLIVQWGYMQSLCTLMQRLGRGARDPALEAIGIYLVEREHFDGYREAKEVKKREKEIKGKEIACQTSGSKRKREEPKRKVAQKQPRLQFTVSSSNQLLRMNKEDGDSEDDVVKVKMENNADGQSIPGTCHSTGDAQRPLSSTHPSSQPLCSQPTRTHLPSYKHMSCDDYEKAAMDVYINAAERKICRRKVADEYFENHRHDAFLFQSVVMSATIIKRGKNKIKMASYTMNDADLRLKKSLKAWREKQMEEEELDGDDFFGPQYLLSDRLLTRIVDLAHFSKLSTVQILQEQTDWCHASKYGPRILELVRLHIPAPVLPSPFTSAPLPPIASGSASSTPPSVTKASRKCGKCGAHDHIASNQKCPKWQPKSRSNQENIPPLKETLS